MKKALKVGLLVIAGLFVILVTIMIAKDIKPISMGMHGPVYEENGIALKGFDVTTYFEGNLQKGSNAYKVDWEEVSWYFASEENMKRFLSNPESFAPAFGGYCTKAVSTGFTAPNNPEIFEIHQNRLFIFSNEEVRQEFKNDPDAMIGLCESKWN